jgi:predicted peroxiredoxin
VRIGGLEVLFYFGIDGIHLKTRKTFEKGVVSGSERL